MKSWKSICSISAVKQRNAEIWLQFVEDPEKFSCDYKPVDRVSLVSGNRSASVKCGVSQKPHSQADNNNGGD